MANNALPSNTGDLTKLANKMAGGLTALGQTLGITQLTAATLLAEVNVVNTAQTAFNTAREARQTASTDSTNYHTLTGEWLLKARDVLLPYLGRSWSAAWAAAGFTNHSTSVAGSVGEQFNLLGLVSAYFIANPAYQDQALGITGAAGNDLKGASAMADTVLDAAKTLAATRKESRDAAVEALAGSMRMLIRILNELLASDDPRWATFGLNMPDADTTPAAPQNLTASIAAGPVLLASCDAVPLAERYRWRIKRVGIDPAFQLAASTKSPLAQLNKVMPGQTVELMVQAANQTSQSLPSTSVFVTLPALAERTSSVETFSNGSGEVATGYSSLQASAGERDAAEGNGSARGGRTSNGARH